MTDDMALISLKNWDAALTAAKEKSGNLAAMTSAELAERIRSISADDGRFDALLSGKIVEVKSDTYYLKSNVFSFCPHLKTVDLPNADEIREYAFNTDTVLVSVNVPSAKRIGTYAFYSCSSLEITFFHSVQKFRGDAQFRHCKHLTFLDFPVLDRITGTQSFTDTSLQTLILRAGTICTLESANCFDESPVASGTGFIYVPKALVEQYKVATNWVAFASQIRAIEDYPDITGGAV